MPRDGFLSSNDHSTDTVDSVRVFSRRAFCPKNKPGSGDGEQENTAPDGRQ